MTSNSSKAIPFFVLVIVAGMLSIDMLTEFEINETHITLIGIILTPMGMGGIIKKAWTSYQDVRLAQLETKPKP
jgi:hypothetical protein